MDDFFATLIAIIFLLVIWVPIIIFAKKITKTKGAFNTKAILLCVFTAFFVGPLGLVVVLIIIDNNGNKFTKISKNTNLSSDNIRIILSKDDAYLNKILNVAFDFMEEYFSIGDFFTLFIFPKIERDKFSRNDGYIEVQILLSDWWPTLITNETLLDSFTGYFEYDEQEKTFTCKILAATGSDYNLQMFNMISSLIHDFADKYESEHPNIKFERTSSVKFTRTKEEYLKDNKKNNTTKKDYITYYFNHPKILKMIEFIKEVGETPYKIIVNYDCVEIYYPDGIRKFVFEANKIKTFSKAVSYNYTFNTSNIYYLGKAINKHLDNIYTVEEITELFETVYNEYEKDYGTKLLRVELVTKTKSLEIH